MTLGLLVTDASYNGSSLDGRNSLQKNNNAEYISQDDAFLSDLVPAEIIMCFITLQGNILIYSSVRCKFDHGRL